MTDVKRPSSNDWRLWGSRPTESPKAHLASRDCVWFNQKLIPARLTDLNDPRVSPPLVSSNYSATHDHIALVCTYKHTDTDTLKHKHLLSTSSDDDTRVLLLL